MMKGRLGERLAFALLALVVAAPALSAASTSRPQRDGAAQLEEPRRLR